LAEFGSPSSISEDQRQAIAKAIASRDASLIEPPAQEPADAPEAPEATVTPDEPQGSSAAPEGGQEAGQEAPPAPAPPASSSLSQADIERLQQIDRWAQQLTPQEWQVLDAAMRGDLVPRDSIPQPAPAMAPPVAQDEDDYLDPALAQRVAAIEARFQAEIESLRGATNRALETDYLAAQQTREAAAIAAGETFMQRYSLDEATANQVATATMQLGIIPNLLAQYRNPTAEDYRNVFEQALEFTYTGHPAFRDSFIESQVEARVQDQLGKQQVATAKAETRKQNASQLAAIQNRDLPKLPETPDPRAMTEDQRIALMAQMIRQGRG
jgi:hypothetical protein